MFAWSPKISRRSRSLPPKVPSRWRLLWCHPRLWWWWTVWSTQGDPGIFQFSLWNNFQRKPPPSSACLHERCQKLTPWACFDVPIPRRSGSARGWSQWPFGFCKRVQHQRSGSETRHNRGLFSRKTRRSQWWFQSCAFFRGRWKIETHFQIWRSSPPRWWNWNRCQCSERRETAKNWSKEEKNFSVPLSKLRLHSPGQVAHKQTHDGKTCRPANHGLLGHLLQEELWKCG